MRRSPASVVAVLALLASLFLVLSVPLAGLSEARQLTIDRAAVAPPATATWTLTAPPSATLTHTPPMPTRTASSTPSLTLIPSPTPSPTPSRTHTPWPTFTPTPTSTQTATITLTPTTTPTPTESATPSASPSPSPTEGPTHTPSPTREASPTPTGGFIPPSPTPRPEGRTDTDEPNDYWTMAAPLQPGIHQSYISHERDLDWFKVFVEEPRSELRVTLSNPPADYDLALLTDPAGIPAGLAGIRTLADLGDINQAGQLATTEDIGDLATLQDTRPVRAISARSDLASESIEVDVLQQPGWYYVLVKGYNGAYSMGVRQVGEQIRSRMNLQSDLPRPYTLQIEIDPPTDSRRCAVELPHPPGVIIARWIASETPETLILVNKRRMDAYYGGGPGLAEQLLAEIRALASHPIVNGVIEPVENDPEVSTAYNAWDADACSPEAANRVTEAIKDQMNEVLEIFPTIRQVLIVGNDDIIPFHRVVDEVKVASESEYVSQVDANPDSPFYSSLEQGYVLTDDFYVDDEPLAWRGRRLYVPDRPIGRLVESPEEMIDAIEIFLQSDGRLSLQTGFVLGYDFSAGSSNRIADILRSAGITVDSMTTTQWTGSDLRDSLLDTHHDVNVVNVRFSHNEATSPDESDGPLTAEAIAEVGSQLRRSLFLSIGSHAGLNVPDRWAAASDQLDFGQAFCGLGVASVANTGYGYGAAHAAGYSELLMTYFVEELTDAPDVTVGVALTRAKQRFFRVAGPASLGLYHEKALIEASLLGIPNLRISVPNRAIPTGDMKRVTLEPMELVRQDLYRRSVRLEPRFERVDTPAGSYFTADDGTISRPGRPVQPRFTWNIRRPEFAAHGALLTHATYTDFLHFDPLITRPLTDTADTEPTFPFDVWTPARPHVINRLTTADGTSEQLVVVPGQFKPASPSSSHGVERRYDSLTYDLYYSTSTDWTPPTIWQV
ncbi:MAG: hypothetical protein ACE5LU_21960, partial [Anaerolineae bacterium]